MNREQVVSLIVLALVVGSCVIGVAQEEGIGAAAFLRQGVDARALAMGGAFVAVTDGDSSIYWNPAGLARVRTIQLGGMYSDIYGADLAFSYIGSAIGWDLQPGITDSYRLGIGGAFTEFATEVRAGDQYGNPLGIIRYSESLFSAGGALYVPNLGYVGATAKAYRFLAPNAGVGGEDATAFGIGFDAGLIASVWNGFYLGIAATDIGNAKIKWNNTPTEPTDIVLARYTVGAAFSWEGLILAADYVFQPQADDLIRAGGEYNLWFLFLRAGIVKRLDGPLSLSAGVGVEAKDLRFDAAWLQNKDVEVQGAHDTIIISAEFGFGSLFTGLFGKAPEGSEE